MGVTATTLPYNELKVTRVTYFLSRLRWIAALLVLNLESCVMECLQDSNIIINNAKSEFVDVQSFSTRTVVLMCPIRVITIRPARIIHALIWPHSITSWYIPLPAATRPAKVTDEPGPHCMIPCKSCWQWVMQSYVCLQEKLKYRKIARNPL